MMATQHKAPAADRRRQISVRHAHNAPTLSFAPAKIVQRAHSCACGGSCPRCKAGHLSGTHSHEANPVAEHASSGEATLDETGQTGQTVEQFAHAGGESADVSAVVASGTRGGGRPLDAATRAFMESSFNRDFGSVRVHTGASAEQSAQSIDALAYTAGNDVVFGEGQYAAGTDQGRRLLAHELTHVVQQSQSGGTLQPALRMGAVQDAAEIEADRVADWVMAGPSATPMPVISGQHAGTVRRQPRPAQARGGPPQTVVLDQPPRGEDTVRIHISRYLCNCMGRNVSRSRLSARVRPRLGIVYEFCNGRTTIRLTGEAEPSSFTTGRVTVGLDVNVAAEQGGTGARVQVQGEARNTGSEPQVGGTASVQVAPGGRAPNVGLSGGVLVGTQTGQVDTNIRGGVDLGRGVTGGVTVTNPQAPNWSVIFGVGGQLPGQAPTQEFCRECNCPVVYECIEDIPPRQERDPPQTVIDTSRLRYYFRLDRNEDAVTPALRVESNAMLDRLAGLIGDGWSISRISGYASPEAAEHEHNEPLSLSRAERLRDRIVERLGAGVSLPPVEAGGELLGSIPTMDPGSSLADAMFDAGFSGPEEVSMFLFGDEIANDQLADQFLRLLDRVVTPDDRLRLFGLTANSPIAARLLTAINQFIARRGRGSRPWESIFEYLRFAAVEVTHARQVESSTYHYTSGSVREIGEAPCNRFAREAEDAALFGPAEREPTADSCPPGHSPNLPDYDSKCDYSG